MLLEPVGLRARDMSDVFVPLNEISESDDIDVFNFVHFYADNGLNSNSVKTICLDKDGRLWLGTDDGVYSFDGYSFTKYLPERNNPKSIYGKDVRSLRFLDDNHIIIALADGGISIYDERTGEFKTGTQSAIESYVEGNPYPNDLEYQTSYGLSACENDNIYIAFEDFIVHRNERTGVAQRIPLSNHRKYSGVVTDKVEIEPFKGNDSLVCIMLGKSSFGILNNRYGSIKEVRFSRRASEYINDICAIDNHRCYIATSKGLYLYDVWAKRIRLQPIPGVRNVHCIIKDNDEGYWLMYDNSEILNWNPIDKSYRRLNKPTDVLGKHMYVNDMLEDENGVLWVATSNSGLFKFDTKPSKIGTYSLKNELPDNYNTYNIHGNSNTTLYASCGFNGVLKMDLKNSMTRLYELPEQNVLSVYERKDGTICVGTTKGAYIFDGKMNFVKEVPFAPAKNDSINRIIVNDITEDCLGNIWLATQRGLYKYNGYKVERQRGVGMKGENVDCVYEDYEGRIWCGLKSGSYFKAPTDTFFIPTDAYEINKSPNNHTYCFCDYGNRVLIGTASGILSYDKESKHVTAAEFSNYFDNCIIYSLLRTSNDILWISSNSGIGYVDMKNAKAYKFNHYDGLKNIGNECHKFALVGDNLIFGRAATPNVIDVNNVALNHKLPRTYISRMSYGQAGNSFSLSQKGGSVYETHYLMRASLSIVMSSSDLSIPSRNEYKYRLEKDDWVYVGTSNEIYLSGLTPGEYRLEVMSSNCDKIWSGESVVFYIRIIPPMWLSIPALIFYGIMILAVLWLLLDMRLKNVNRKVRLMAEEMRGKRAIEDQRNRLAKIHKDQTDSISYAKHIQEAIMHRSDTIDKAFNKLFVLYKPKDIVSGDFYRFFQRDDKSFVIAADCTGHGVPGAFISILGMDHLNNIIMRQKIDDPGEILTELHKETFGMIYRNDSSKQNFNDGIDLTISVVHHKEHKIEFAGAMNDMYMIRQNEIITFRGDHFSIGTNVSLDPAIERTPKYRTHVVNYERGDIFYVFSDGFLDQFGGPEQKKFKYRRFKHLLLNIHKMPARDQKIILNRRLEEWKGVNEQTDDICVIGFEPWVEENSIL